LLIGVKAERTSLEDVANPLSLVGRADSRNQAGPGREFGGLAPA
jgi:hypothetical protein